MTHFWKSVFLKGTLNLGRSSDRLADLTARRPSLLQSIATDREVQGSLRLLKNVEEE